MAIRKSDYAAGRKPQPYPGEAGVVVAARASFSVPTDIAANDIVELLALPSGCRLVDAIFDSDDLDTGGAAAIVWDIGIMSGAYGSDDPARVCGDQLFDGINTSQAGGVARTTDRRALRLGGASVARGVGAKLVTAAATPAAGEIGLTLFYVAAP